MQGSQTHWNLPTWYRTPEHKTLARNNSFCCSALDAIVAIKWKYAETNNRSAMTLNKEDLSQQRSIRPTNTPDKKLCPLYTI